MAERVVTLREEHSEDSAYFLRARLREDGALVLEGQDLGATPEEFWGSREYEWEITVGPQAVPRLVTALGGTPGENDPLELLAARFQEDQRYGTRAFLEEAGVPFDFWSRVGE